VFMTAMGANLNPTSPMRKAELQLEASGVPFAVIRPNWFLQNFNTYWLDGILRQGAILLPTGTARCSFIDARDISRVAAELLTSDRFPNEEFDLTGPEAVTHDHVAEVLTRVSGRTIRYQEVSTDEMRDRLLAAGLPLNYVEFMLVILGYLKAGYSEAVTDCVERITGRPPVSLKEYANDYRNTWA
jgi:uncharacterized protein YbjT (DUF2867 family)